MKNKDLLLVAALIFGGMSDLYMVISLCLMNIWLTISYYEKRKKRIPTKTPSGFVWFLVFILLALVSMIWTRDISKGLLSQLLFTSSGLTILYFYNSEKDVEKFFQNTLFMIGLYFGSLYILNGLFHFFPMSSSSLFVVEPTYQNHNHLGDLWAVIVVLTLTNYDKTKKKNYFKFFIIFLGFIFIALSRSRSALLGMGIGLFSWSHFTKLNLKENKLVRLAIVFIIFFFLVMGLSKGLLSSRPYFLKSILSVLQNPFGLGMGNYKYISDVNYTDLTHNLLLEPLVGLGILSIPFFIWFYKLVRKIVSKTKKENVVYSIVVIVLGTNFLFDSTYWIPTMLFIWSASIGLFYKTVDN